MRLVWSEPQRVADWVAAQYGCAAPTVDAAIGTEEQGRLVAGVYFDGLHGNNVFAHIAGRPGADLLQSVAAYVKLQLHLDRMTFQVAADNYRAIKFVEKMGARKEAELADAAAPGVPLLLYALRTDSRFIQRLLARRH